VDEGYKGIFRLRGGIAKFQDDHRRYQQLRDFDQLQDGRELKGLFGMFPKIIGLILGLAAVGLYAWIFKETPLCRP
jgi:hypothetical protein